MAGCAISSEAPPENAIVSEVNNARAVSRIGSALPQHSCPMRGPCHGLDERDQISRKGPQICNSGSTIAGKTAETRSRDQRHYFGGEAPEGVEAFGDRARA